MKTMRLLPIIVVLGLLVVALTATPGCGGKSAPGGDTRAVELDLDTVILTVDGDPVYWPEFLYWLRFIAGYYETQNDLEAIADWTTQINGAPLKDFFLSSAVDYAGRHRALETHAAGMGFAITGAQRQEMASIRAENVSVYGSESEYQRIIRQTYVSESVYDYLLEIGYLSQQVFAALYGDGGEKCTDADVSAYVSAKGLLSARYVFLSNTGTGTAPLSAEEKAGNRDLLEDLIGRLDRSDDPIGLFADFVTQYGQDPDAAPYTDGVVFTSAAMPAEFMAAFDQLEENQWSGVVETGEGLYLIMRVPLRPDMIADQAGNTLRYRAAYEYLYEKQVNAWYADMKVEFAKAYDSIDVERLFGADPAPATSTP